jgi:hypothetical protein
VKDDPFPKGRPGIEGDVRIEDGVITDGGVLAHHDPGIKGDPIADPASFPDKDKGVD